MGYLHINNLYSPKAQTILLFKECYEMEKVHGTSTHITFDCATQELTFFAGGTSYTNFVALFDQAALKEKFLAIGLPPDRKITVFGEGYGGKEQGMSATYGPKLCFIAFDVQIGDYWQDVPNAAQIVENLGLEFVPWSKISTDLAALDAARDKDSEVAIRRGMGAGKRREGVVLRPLVEVRLNSGDRVICKHKQDWARENATPRKVLSPQDEETRQRQFALLADADAVATEWCTYTRLEHVLDKLPGHCMEKMREIINAMWEDVIRESDGEVKDTDQIKKACSKMTVSLYKDYQRIQLEKKTA